jgi:hypoxia up-regulated 1
MSCHPWHGEALIVLQAGRFPQDSFSSLKFLQAAPYDADVVAFYATISTGETEETSRGTVALRRPDGTTWAVEELVAMQLAYVKDLAEALAGERIVDTVVTVPPFYSQFERDALADAVEVAGLRTLALINDGAAVAVNYAMTRTFATPEYHVMYDAGASAIRATVVQFATIEGKKKADAHTQLTVAGVGYDRGVGGTELDRRLRDLLLADFEAKHKKDLRSDKRGMARLWKEASRVKAILSANADSRVTVESIAWDIDYKSKMTREQFENACGDLKPKFIAPITDAIANAGLTLVCV